MSRAPTKKRNTEAKDGVAENLTGALEDYLETIYLLIRERGFARVKDIAKARSVKAGSVSPALRRLADLGLVEYEQREYIGLTTTGQRAARRVFARHRVLKRFFQEVLAMPAESAETEACHMEHSLTDEAMDRFVRFFEFMTICPHVGTTWLDAFHRCDSMRDAGGESMLCPLAVRRHFDDAGQPSGYCVQVSSAAAHCRVAQDQSFAATVTGEQNRVADLAPGKRGVVVALHGSDAVRQRLLDMGILPGTMIEVRHIETGGQRVRVSLDQSELSLRRSEAVAIVIDPKTTTNSALGRCDW